eukprot:RCo005131
MALWNAPRSIMNHKRAAVGAALDMQSRLLQLHRGWVQAGIPTVRFRIGINTDTVLVGNFGCEHRINYTVLGDGVNLASRLEATNKPFGTVALVSESTQSQLHDDFAFRRIGGITVPGKTEVLVVYEPLFRLPSAASPRSPPMSPPLPPCTSSGSCNTRDSSCIAILVEVAPAPEYPTEEISDDDTVLNAWRMVSKPALQQLTESYEEGMRHFVAGSMIPAEGA